jgi:rhodanese-related sulfurtransferase
MSSFWPINNNGGVQKMYEKLKSFKLLIIVVLVVLGFGGLILTAPKDKSNNSSPAFSIQTIKNDIAVGGQMIDVRTAEEYTVNHIDSAVNLPLQDIQAGKMPSVSKNKPVYIYCHSGNRSSQATAILKAAGYKNITDLGAMTHVQSLGGVLKT